MPLWELPPSKPSIPLHLLTFRGFDRSSQAFLLSGVEYAGVIPNLETDEKTGYNQGELKKPKKGDSVENSVYSSNSSSIAASEIPNDLHSTVLGTDSNFVGQVG